MTEWRDIDGHPGYQISDDGEVRSFWSKGKRAQVQSSPQRILKPQRGGHYFQVTFSHPHYHTRRIHNLVAEAWLGPCPENLEILHGPLGAYDNSVSNLSYGTHKQNQGEMRRDGHVEFGEDHKWAVLTEVQVLEIKRLLSLPDGERPYQKEIAAQFNIKQPTVSNIKTGKIWGYLEE